MAPKSVHEYKCVNCGKDAPALFRYYSPTVLKLCKCDSCGGIVDKYVEYDPVIVMIDLVLMCREAQRHVLYNTEFKQYWKLLIVLMILETYGVWYNESLVTSVANVMCEEQRNGSFWNNSQISDLQQYIQDSWKGNCWAWRQNRVDESDHFIWEKDFYINFICTFLGVAAFVTTTYILMGAFSLISKRKSVSLERLLKAFALCNSSLLLSLARLVWAEGGEGGAEGAVHYALVLAYSCILTHHVFTVIYERDMLTTLVVILSSYFAKLITTLSVTPLIREMVR